MATEVAIYNQWYDTLIEDLADLITETEFTARWALVEGYHQVGSRILQENDNFERSRIYSKNLLQRIAKSLGKSERTLYYAVQFAKLYPDLNLLNEGKNISWHHIVNKYLTTREKKPTIKRGDLVKQIEAFKELLNTEYLRARQQEVGCNDMANTEYDCLETFIRHLQDQLNKITGETSGR